MSETTFITGDPGPLRTEEKRAGRWRSLPKPTAAARLAAHQYVMSPGLIAAVNVALTLGKPLLVTGDPGTGKTQLASYIAWELDMPLHVFVAKSTTAASDLIYTFDAVSHLSDALGGKRELKPLDRISWQAVGKAALDAMDETDIDGLVSRSFERKARTRSVVLIDELDKAPREVPNDLLVEIESNNWPVAELDRKLTFPPGFSPIVVITSNAEKSLPDAFLRRCVYFHIDAPEPEALRKIVEARLDETWKNADGLVGDLLDLYARARKSDSGITRRPATSELIDALLVLIGRYGAQPLDRLNDHPEWRDAARTTLFKRREDAAAVERLMVRGGKPDGTGLG